MARFFVGVTYPNTLPSSSSQRVVPAMQNYPVIGLTGPDPAPEWR